MKTIIVGFDAFDPVIFENLHTKGKTPNLSRFVENGGYTRFQVSNPPQSEVSWTSIATGMNPGEHGIFDFVHRNPANYSRQVSLLTTKTSLLGRQFVPPHRATTIFDVAVADGYPAVSMWWPATFPAKLESPVWSIPGLGTPDIFGRLGVGFFYSMEGVSGNSGVKTEIFQLTQVRENQFRGEITGPSQLTRSGRKSAVIQFQLEVLNEKSVSFKYGKQSVEIELGKWSPVLEMTFNLGFGLSIKSVFRIILKQINPDPQLYFTPLQIHPLSSVWPYATPKRFVKDVWKNSGPYLSLGWPQDTTALEEGFITDEQFLDLCNSIQFYREQAFTKMIDVFEEGILACVFDSLDRIQHMFLRDRPDIVESWYIKMDSLFGRIQERVAKKPNGDDIHLMVISDHGFGEYAYQVDLNRWLVNRGYLVQKKEKENDNLDNADWSKSKAYAIGLNSLYLNIENRESEGILTPDDRKKVLQVIKDDLLEWVGPNGQTVIQNVPTQEEAFRGPYTEFGPDLIIGYRPRYRASARTGLGQWKHFEIQNNKDHWGADHCFDADAVAGVFFSNRGLENYSKLSYKDVPPLAVGKNINVQKNVSDPIFSDEDQESIEQRLKGLGYL